VRPTSVSRLAAVGAALLAFAGTSSARCGAGPPENPNAAAPLPQGAVTPTTAADTPRVLTGVDMVGPANLRLLTAGRYLDVDATTSTPVAITEWLPRPDSSPLLLESVGSGAEFGRKRVSSRTESALPGGVRVVRVTGPVLGRVAPSAAGGLWLEEYVSATHCTLREVGFDGRPRRPARDVTCGMTPVGETRHGLWVNVGPDALTAARVTTGPADYHAVLLDPATFVEKRQFPAVELIDQDRILVIDQSQPGDPLTMRDLATGEVTAIPRPSWFSFRYPQVGPASPDGRWLAVAFGDPSTFPQVADVWLIDLHNLMWTHLPSMPAYAALKSIGMDWAADGRLVLVGQFYENRRDFRELLVTWRPGEPALALRPYTRSVERGAAFLVWPPP
jgi:hypothetical protein